MGQGQTPPAGPSPGNPPPVPYRVKRTPTRTPSETSFGPPTPGGHYSIMNTLPRHATNPPNMVLPK